MNTFSHFDESGAARMVHVGPKGVTQRMARASSRLKMSAGTIQLLQAGNLEKGDVLQVARLAGIMAAKRTSDLIPLCHPLPLDAVNVDFEFADNITLHIAVEVHTTARTGVEMEALTAASVAALTVYDMCKSVDRGMIVEHIQLEEKLGGQSGHYRRK